MNNEDHERAEHLGPHGDSEAEEDSEAGEASEPGEGCEPDHGTELPVELPEWSELESIVETALSRTGQERLRFLTDQLGARRARRVEAALGEVWSRRGGTANGIAHRPATRLPNTTRETVPQPASGVSRSGTRGEPER